MLEHTGATTNLRRGATSGHATVSVSEQNECCFGTAAYHANIPRPPYERDEQFDHTLGVLVADPPRIDQLFQGAPVGLTVPA